MKALALLCLFMSTAVFGAELELSQSSPSLRWKTIENDFVKLIYPEQVSHDSAYIANLIEHYSSVVGQTYGIKKPKKVTLVLRSEVAEPNGFVTLMPRRTEWFTSSSFSALVGSSEWYQTLAIHEYRHVQQYDFSNQGFIKVLDYLAGDMGHQLGSFAGLLSWYFEGDAVWSETKYSEAGRGRSPLFLARLKALVLGDKIPTYDQFVNGTYNNSIPNQYVYGYVLISRATQKFGEDFWPQVIAKVASLPHPFRLYSAFREISGEDFFKFYDETMQELKSKWASEKMTVKRSDYRDNLYPYQLNDSFYYLHSDLDSYHSIYRKSGEEKEKIADISIVTDLSGVSFAGEMAVYTQFFPHLRYGYKGSSDLVLVDLKTGSQTKITSGIRAYYPAFTPSGNFVYATLFDNNQDWLVAKFDLEGNIVDRFKFKDHKVAQIAPINDHELGVVLTDITGKRSIAYLNLESKKIDFLALGSHNLINNIVSADNNQLFFEAQYKGAVNIFKIDLNKNVAQCTTETIGAFTPYINNGSLFYSASDYDGSHIHNVPLSKCFKVDDLFTNYLGENPSDNYNKFPPTYFPNQEKLQQENNYQVKDYGHFDSRLFVPHSWNFFVGKGFGLNLMTDNYLRTMSIGAAFGKEGNENVDFATFQFDIKKFWPIISLKTGMRDREIDLYNSNQDLTWKEKDAGLSITVPFIQRFRLFNSVVMFEGHGDYLETSNYRVKDTNITSGREFFYRSGGMFYAEISKDRTYKSIYSPLAINYQAIYDNAHSPKDRDLNAHRFFHSASLNLPGFFKHNVFRFEAGQEKTNEDKNRYKFLPYAENALSSVFSRGYEYDTVPEYRKVSANYSFPVAYPDLALGGWYYLKRIHSNLFFDSTVVDYVDANKTLNSTGLEIELESSFLRRLPINLGGRYAYKLHGASQVGEFYISSAFGF